MKSRLLFVVALMLGAVGMLFTTKVSTAQQPTIKVGIMHALSGTMAISETTLKDTVLMLIAEQNKKGGLLGRQLEAVVVDPTSDWPKWTEKAAQLLEKDKVAVVFGCWTSVSRSGAAHSRGQWSALYPVQPREKSRRRDLHRRSTESASDPRGGLPDGGMSTSSAGCLKGGL
jgi:urea transport system substrate-binding protein